MTATAPKREVFSNPFFVVLLLASVVFVATVLAYLMSATILEPGSLANSQSPPEPPPSAGSVAVATWLDRYALWLLAIEFGIMFVAGVLAMLTDRWFSPKSKPNPPARA